MNDCDHVIKEIVSHNHYQHSLELLIFITCRWWKSTVFLRQKFGKFFVSLDFLLRNLSLSIRARKCRNFYATLDHMRHSCKYVNF